MALGPEHALQMDIFPFDESSGGYNAIVTAMDVFSRYHFTYNVVKTDAPTVARVLVDIMTRHAYLPTTVITDKATQFMSEVMADATRILGIQLKHATTKHAQTIGILERCHASLEESLKISTGERRTMWQQYVAIATVNYNTSYHWALGCKPSRVFHKENPLQCPGPQVWHPKWTTLDTDNKPRRRHSTQNATDQRSSEQKFNAILHTIQTVLRQKSKCSPPSRQRIMLRTTPQNEYPEYQNPIQRIPLDSTLHRRQSACKQQLPYPKTTDELYANLSQDPYETMPDRQIATG